MGRGSSGPPGSYQPAGIYGWRKQCLYAVILFILIIVIMNLALTVWILRVLNFNIEGLNMGTIIIQGAGITIGGKTDVIKNLFASKISSKHNRRLTISADKDILLKTDKTDNRSMNKFMIGKSGIDAVCDSFEVRDLSGNSRFKVTEKGVTYGVEEVSYSGKAIFNGSIETPNIRGPYRGSLRLESVSSSIVVSGRDNVNIEAPVGNIELKSSNNIVFNANKKISFNSTDILLPHLVQISSPVTDDQYNDVLQLCMCQNGRLFLAPSSGKCVTQQSTCS